MKIEKKHIIIAIVAAVAFWLFWKKKNEAGNTATGNTATDDKAELDYILSHVNFTGTEKTKIRAVYNKTQTDEASRQRIQNKAYENGYSFAQQVVFDALWLLYTKDNEWIDGRWSYVDKLQKAVLAL